MNFNSIHTERLLIRRLTAADAAPLAEYRSHPQVAKFQASWSFKKAEELIQEMSASSPLVKAKWFQFAIELKTENRLIGDIGFLNSDENGKSWVGFTLNPSYWGQGFAKESVNAVLQFYKNSGLTEVWASTDPENQASMRLLNTLGFALVNQTPDDMVFLKNLN